MWTGAEEYERVMGRWSRRIAPSLIAFAGVETGERVLEVGCGTGSLTRALLGHDEHLHVTGVDPSAQYIEHGRRAIASPRLSLQQADAQDLPFDDHEFDRCLSLLVLNFIPDVRRALDEMRRVTRPGGTIAAAVWDYGDGMQMLRILWDAAVSLDPDAAARHERNMPYCRQGELGALWEAGGLRDVEEGSLSVTLQFASFEDYWRPFLSGVGPSGSYVSALPEAQQIALRDLLRSTLPGQGPFELEARAWAVRGTVPVG